MAVFFSELETADYSSVIEYQFNLTTGLIEGIVRYLYRPFHTDEGDVQIVKFAINNGKPDKLKEVYIGLENQEHYRTFRSISNNGISDQYLYVNKAHFNSIDKMIEGFTLSLDSVLQNLSNEMGFRQRNGSIDAVYYEYNTKQDNRFDSKGLIALVDYVKNKVISEDENNNYERLVKEIFVDGMTQTSAIYSHKNGANYLYMRFEVMKTDEKSNYQLGKYVDPWEGGLAKTVTFVVTEDCQLRCKYCYIVGKNSREKMSLDVAKKTIDYLIGINEQFEEKSLIIEFIGGEPLIEITMIDRITDYFKIRMYETGCRWFDSYRINITTNGLLYSEPRVQDYINKNRAHISVAISIDGIKEKHDLQRVYPDGGGSFDDVVKNIPLWMKQFPDAQTKVTVSSDDITYIGKSVIYLWELGMQNVLINTVFENVWKDGDEELFEKELRVLADYIIDNNLFKERNYTFFSDFIGFPLFDNQNWCGAGKMLAIDPKGNFYPCIRFVPYSMNRRKEGRKIGDIYAGINSNLLRPFLALNRTSQSTDECIDCEVASGCAWCQGLNYDDAETDTIYQRATHICKMHKARVRANNYYWDKLYREKGINREIHYV